MATTNRFRGPLNSHPPSPILNMAKARPEAHYSLHPTSSHTRHTTSPYTTTGAAQRLKFQTKSPPPTRVLVDASLLTPRDLPEPTVSGASTVPITSPPASLDRPISAPPRVLLSMSRRRRYYRPASIITTLPTIPEAISSNSSSGTSTSTSNRSSTTSPTNSLIRPSSPLNLTSPITRSSQFAPSTLPAPFNSSYPDGGWGRSQMISSPPPSRHRSAAPTKPQKPLHLHLRHTLTSLYTLPHRLLHRKRNKLARLEHTAHRIRVDHIVAKQHRAIHRAGGIPLSSGDEIVWGWRILPKDEIADYINFPPTQGTGHGAVQVQRTRDAFLESCDCDLESGTRLVEDPELEMQEKDFAGEWLVNGVCDVVWEVGRFVYHGVRWVVRMVRRGWREGKGLGKEAIVMGEDFGLNRALWVLFLLLLGLVLCVGAVLA